MRDPPSPLIKHLPLRHDAEGSEVSADSLEDGAAIVLGGVLWERELTNTLDRGHGREGYLYLTNRNDWVRWPFGRKGTCRAAAAPKLDALVTALVPILGLLDQIDWPQACRRGCRYLGVFQA